MFSSVDWLLVSQWQCRKKARHFSCLWVLFSWVFSGVQWHLMNSYFSLSNTLFSSESKSHSLWYQESVDSSDVESYGVDPSFWLVLFRNFYFLYIYNNFTFLSVFKSLSSMIGEIENTARTNCTGSSSRKQAKRC